MTLVIPPADRELMRGVIDMHLHALPCLLDRPFDEIDVAIQARDAGFRALVLKSIFTGNADRVELVRKSVPGIDLFGGVVFNHTVGGLNPIAMRAAIGFGAKVVWMPTVHAANHIDYFGVATYPWVKHQRLRTFSKAEVTPIRLIDEHGKLRPEVLEIIDLAADAGIVIATGHIAADEIFALLSRCREIGHDKVVCTHVGWHATDWSLDDMKRMAELGATLEFTINPCMPARQQADPADFAKRILEVGAEHCITATDLGQRDNAHPVEGYRMFLRILIDNGLGDRDIDLVARRNPARLLDLSVSGTEAAAAELEARSLTAAGAE